MFTSLEAALLKIGKGIASWLGDHFLKVWNGSLSGFNSRVSIKLEIKIHLSVYGGFLFFPLAAVGLKFSCGYFLLH